MAFIVAALIVIVTFGWAGLILFAAGMSDGPTDTSGDIWWVLGVGIGLAAIVASSHWWRLSW